MKVIQSGGQIERRYVCANHFIFGVHLLRAI